MIVVHCKRNKYTVYIGRPSIFGNPFKINGEQDRVKVIEKYNQWVRKQPEVIEAIRKLKPDDILGCFCSPKPCHGDVIMRIWYELF